MSSSSRTGEIDVKHGAVSAASVPSPAAAAINAVGSSTSTKMTALAIKAAAAVEKARVADTAASTTSTTTTSTATALSVQPVSLLVSNLDDIVVEYVADIKKYSENYTRTAKTTKTTFFENRLAVGALLQHAVHGEMKQVNEMLTKNPLLLLEKGTVIDYSGRKHYQRTVYQLALGAVYCDVKDEKGSKILVPGMVEMIEPHFDRLPGLTADEKNAIMDEQHAGQFPIGSKEIDDKRMMDDSKELNAVINVITAASDDDCKATDILENQIHEIIRKENTPRALELNKIINSIYKSRSDEDFEAAFNELKNKLITEGLTNASFNFTVLKAIYQFRRYLEPSEMMTIGRHFNHHLLAEMDTLYYKNYVAFGNDPFSPKNRLIWQKIFGYIERFVPACDGRVIAQGPWAVLVSGEPYRDSLQFSYGGAPFFPLDSDLDWELGYSVAAVAANRSRRAGLTRAGAFKTYVEQKQQLGSQLYAATLQPAETCMCAPLVLDNNP